MICLQDESNEADYIDYIEYLSCLESNLQVQKNNERELNLIVTLVNAWFLSKKQIVSKDEDNDRNKLRENKKVIANTGSHINTRMTSLISATNLLLQSAMDDDKYEQYLAELRNMKDDLDLYCWLYC